MLLLVLAIGAACAPKTANLTPAGQQNYTADQIALRVNELQNAAIKAEAGGALPTATTRIIVTFAGAADRVLAKTPDGWRAQVLTLWQEAKKQLAKLPGINTPAVIAGMAAVDVALGVIQ